jgi:predicted TIM-barrel fold metal-dependent hydrolase
MTTVTANVSTGALPRPETVGAYDTDVHFYVKDGINSVLPYVPLQWRRTFEMRGTKLGGDTPVPQRFEFPTGSRLRVDAFTPDGGLPGTDADFARGDLLDRFDLAGSVLSSLEAGQMAQGFAGTEASSVLCSAFNDYALEHWYDVDHRFRIAICVPSVHPEAAAAEVRRLSEHPGVAAIYVPLLHTPLGSRHFYPIYEAAQERGLPIFLHITAAEFNYQGTPAYPTGWLENFSERRVAYTLLGPVALSSLIFSGTLDRFPRLNFAFIEFGFAWAVPLMWRMDSTWRYARVGTPWLKMPPSHYLRERIKFGTQPVDDPDNQAEMDQLIDMLGPETLMFSTDYPHWDGDTPGRVFQTVPSSDKELIFRGNASNTFRF